MTGLERKITTDFVHDFVRGMTTVAEYIERREFADAVQKIPETTPEISMRDSGYIGKHEQNVSVYDAMMAEIHADKAIRAEKFRKTHDLCKKSKDDTPADRKRNKIRRIQKLYGECFEDGKDWYWENGKEGQKKSTKPDAEIFRNLKDAELERSAYADMIPDTERYVGKTTLQKQVLNKYAEMMKIREDFCKANQLNWDLDDYAKTSVFGFVVFYPAEYYRAKEEYEMLAEKRDKAFQRKLEKGKSVDNGSLWTVNNKERWSEYGRV